MKHYTCIIKSHCEAPDFEAEGEANSKEEFVNQLCDLVARGEGGSYELFFNNTEEI